MEDVASSHTFMEGETVPNKTTGKKKIFSGNALLLASQKISTRICSTKV
jgi:hypothetical protein